MTTSCPHCGEKVEQIANAEHGSNAIENSEVEVWVEGNCPKCRKPITARSSAHLKAHEVPSESELIDQAADGALDRIHTTGTRSIRHAAKAAVQPLKAQHSWFHRDIEAKETTERVLERIAEKTPDEWHGTLDYSCEDYPYRLTNVTPCPNCGQKGTFNIRIEEGAQMVRIADETFAPDDFFDQEIISVVCNACFEDVHRERAESG